MEWVLHRRLCRGGGAQTGMTEYSHQGNGAHGTKLERQQGDPAIKQCNPPGDWSSNDRRSAEYHQPARYKPFVAYQDHG